MSIEVKGISKRFASHAALDKLDLDFPTGQLIALLGPSGCGKTTLLRIIAGLEQADSGEVWLEGVNVTQIPIRERQIGFMFQHYALFPHMTVFDNVAFGLSVKPRLQRLSAAAIRERVNELLALVQLESCANRYPEQLSGGQRQRIALARALAVQPSVLLLDEPFGALDAQVRKELRRWLRDLHHELNITSILVTHDQEEALEVADQIVLMQNGKVEQIGTPQALFSQPSSAFAYQFLGQVNRFHGYWQHGHFVEQHSGLPVYTTNTAAYKAGTPLLGFARPHELEILPMADACPLGVVATVVRVWLLGALARIELRAAHAEAETRYYEIDMLLERFKALTLVEGQTVQVVPRHLQLFAA